MPRVFLATDTALVREIVITVLVRDMRQSPGSVSKSFRRALVGLA